MIKNPWCFVLVFIIGYIVRFCFHSCVNSHGFYLTFIVIYISILPAKYFIYVIISSLKKGFHKDLLYEGFKYSSEEFNKQVTLSIIFYYFHKLLLSKIPFVIILKWSEIDYNNIGKFFFNNKQFFIRGILVKINFEPLFWEMRKILPYVDIKLKCSLNVIYDAQGNEIILGDTVPVRDARHGFRIEYPTDRIFSLGITHNVGRNSGQTIQYDDNLSISQYAYSNSFNNNFNNLVGWPKINEPQLTNAFNQRELLAIAQSPTDSANPSTDFRILNPVRQLFDDLFSHHVYVQRSDHNGNKLAMSNGIHYNYRAENKCFLIVKVNWYKPSSPLASMRRVQILAAELCYDKNIPKNNKFLVNIEPHHMTFFIYQNNFFRDFTHKQWYAKDLVCVVLGPNGITPAPQTYNGRFSVVPYNINDNPNSILAILNYMATCPTVPTLRFANGAIHIDTPPAKPNVTDQVKALDAFKQIRSNGTITDRSNPMRINSLLNDQ